MSTKINRRDFLRLAGTTGAALIVLGAKTASGAQASVTKESKHRWAMVIDQAKCTGCGDCTLACRASNDVAKGKEWNVVLQDNLWAASRCICRARVCTANIRRAPKCAR